MPYGSIAKASLMIAGIASTLWRCSTSSCRGSFIGRRTQIDCLPKCAGRSFL